MSHLPVQLQTHGGQEAPDFGETQFWIEPMSAREALESRMRGLAKELLPSENYYDLAHWRYFQRNKRARANLTDFVETGSVFVHIPKAAGCSVGLALYPRGWGGHRTLRDFRVIFGRRLWSFYRFTFVRNPFTRLVSAYDYLSKGGHPDRKSVV